MCGHDLHVVEVESNLQVRLLRRHLPTQTKPGSTICLDSDSGTFLTRSRTTDSLEVVLHLAQLGHDGDRVRLAGCLLDGGVLFPLSDENILEASGKYLPAAA